MAVAPASAGEQWFTVTMYDWGFWIVDATTGANETNAWNVFEGYTVHVNATSLPADAAIGGTAYHGLGVELNATGQQLLSLAAPVGKWVQGSFVAPLAVYHHQHIWCTIQCGPGHSGQQMWNLNILPALPLPKASATANVTSGRAPLNVSFSGTASGGTPPYTTSWDFGDGTLGASGLSTTHSFTLGGNYSVRFQVTDSKSMTAASTLDVLVTSPARLSATLTATPSSAVVPFPSRFSVIAHGGTPPYSISWSFGDGPILAGPNLTSHLFSAAGVYAVVATVKDSASATVRALASVAALPPAGYFPVAVNATPSNGTAPLVVTLRATPSGGTAPYRYLWVFGDGTSGRGATVQHQFNETGSYEVNLFADDAAGRVGWSAVNIPVTVLSGGGSGDTVPHPLARSASPVPAAGALTIYTVATPTQGGSPLVVNATASVVAGTGTGEAITWQFGDGTNATGATVTHRYAAVGSYNVSVSAKDSGGNTGGNSTQVRVEPLTMTLAANQTSSDAPLVLTAAATIVGGTGRYGTVTWTWPGGGSLVGNLVHHTFPPSLTGALTLQASTTDSAGTPVSATLTVTVNPVLAARIAVILPATIVPPIDVRFSLTVAGGTGSYAAVPLWAFGDGAGTRGPVSMNHMYAKLGKYRVSVQTNDSLGTPAIATAWVNLTVAPPASSLPGGAAPWSLTGVSDPNEAALVLIGMVGASGLGLLYRRRRGKSAQRPDLGGRTAGGKSPP